jgi:hypothetical protein
VIRNQKSEIRGQIRTRLRIVARGLSQQPGTSVINMKYASLNLVVISASLSACAPWATYPPVESKAFQSMSRETFEPVPTVMVVALQYGREHYANDQEVAINLPEDTPAAAYDKVIKKLGWGRPLMLPTDDALHIIEVRTRGFNGEVDMIYQRSDGLHQMVTISMSRTVVNRYKVTGTRVWQLRDLKAPQPTYVPPPPKPEKAK